MSEMTDPSTSSLPSMSSDPSPLSLQEEIVTLRQQIAYLYEVSEEQKKTINMYNDSLPSILKQIADKMSTSSSKPKLPPIATPDAFDGSSDKAQSFLNSVNLYIQAREVEFSTELSKVHFAISYMKEGKAKLWVDNLLNKEDSIADLFPTWRRFVIDFKKQFFDTLQSETARRLIKQTYQGSGTVKDYVIAFEKHELLTGYEEISLIEAFENGLNADLLKDLYRLANPPSNLEQYKESAKQLDEQRLKAEARLAARGLHSKKPYTPSTDKTKSVTPSQPSTSKPAVEQVKSGTGIVFGGSGQPMDLDAARSQRLCFNCGKRGHIAKFCGKLSQAQVRQLDIPSLTKEDMDRINKEWNEANKKDF